MYPIIAPIILMLLHVDRSIWASCAERAAPDDGKKPEKRSDEQDHREASLKQDVDRSKASPRLQRNRPCIVREKTCSHTYVFQTPNGGPYGL